MTKTSYSQLTNEEKELLDSAELALSHAHNPNGRMKVAATVMTVAGKIIAGVCYGNCSSPSNLCAERAAIITANSQGEKNLTAMAIIGLKDGGEKIMEPITPCGACRQVMLETANISGQDLTVICSNSDKTDIIKTSISELLPFPYRGSEKK